MCDGGRALTGLIGEQAPIDAAIERIGETGTKKAAGSCATVEQVRENSDKRRYNLAQVGEDHSQGADNIDDGHQRHDLFRDLNDALDATDDHQKKNDGQHTSGDDGLDPEGLLHPGGDAVDLRHIARTEGTDDDTHLLAGPRATAPMTSRRS